MAGYYTSSYSFRRQKQFDDIDPMTSMTNVGDVMLVFACGLMVALVSAWNLDLAQFQQVEMDKELKQDDVTEMNEQLYGEGNSFVQMGTVYQDPVTGKFYLVEDGKEGSGTSGSSGTSGTSGTSGSGSSGGANAGSSGTSGSGTSGTSTSGNSSNSGS